MHHSLSRTEPWHHAHALASKDQGQGCNGLRWLFVESICNCLSSCLVGLWNSRYHRRFGSHYFYDTWVETIVLTQIFLIWTFSLSSFIPWSISLQTLRPKFSDDFSLLIVLTSWTGRSRVTVSQAGVAYPIMLWSSCHKDGRVHFPCKHQHATQMLCNLTKIRYQSHDFASTRKEMFCFVFFFTHSGLFSYYKGDLCV